MSQINNNNYDMTQYYIALAVAFIVILVTFLLSRRLRKPINVVVLTGLSDSGKTAIFTRIIFNKPKKSVTSLKENDATLADLNLRLVDLPGTDNLRVRFWERYRQVAKQVIFFIDSVTVETKLRDICEYLYILLCDGSVLKNQIQLIIACNKQDMEGAKRKDDIQPLLEKELRAIKSTKTGQLGKTSNEEVEDYLSSLSDDDLSFDNLRINVIETSVHNPEQIIRMIL